MSNQNKILLLKLRGVNEHESIFNFINLHAPDVIDLLVNITENPLYKIIILKEHESGGYGTARIFIKNKHNLHFHEICVRANSQTGNEDVEHYLWERGLVSSEDFQKVLYNE